MPRKRTEKIIQSRENGPTHLPTHHTQTFTHKQRCARQASVPELETESPCPTCATVYSCLLVSSGEPIVDFLAFLFQFLHFAISLLVKNLSCQFCCIIFHFLCICLLLHVFVLFSHVLCQNVWVVQVFFVFLQCLQLFYACFCFLAFLFLHLCFLHFLLLHVCQRHSQTKKKLYAREVFAPGFGPEITISYLW